MTTEAECLDLAVEWLGMQMPVQDWAAQPDVKVVQAIDLLYQGGWHAFVEHCAQADGVS